MKRKITYMPVHPLFRKRMKIEASDREMSMVQLSKELAEKDDFMSNLQESMKDKRKRKRNDLLFT